MSRSTSHGTPCSPYKAEDRMNIISQTDKGEGAAVGVRTGRSG